MRVLAFFTLFLLVHAAQAAGYNRIGLFEWVESENGKTFVREDGVEFTTGTTTEQRYRFGEISTTSEVFSRLVRYKGERLITREPMDTANVHGGIRVDIRATTGPLFAGIEHTMFTRVAEGELWNITTLPYGVRLGGVTLGAKAPLHVSNYLMLHKVGYENVLLKPTMAHSSFVSAVFTIGGLDVELAYARTVLDASEERMVRSVRGRAVNWFYQPPSDIRSLTLQINHLF